MAARTPPRVVTRTMATTFATVVFILGARRAQERTRRLPQVLMTLERIVASMLLALSGTAAVAAQESHPARLSADTATSVTMFSSYKHPSGVFDATVSADIGRGLTAIVRPWFWKRPDGTSTFQFYQLQARYQSRTRVPLRIDAGVITSPLGLSTLQQRADLNPTMTPVFYYVIPLPRFDVSFDGLQMMTAGYPMGAIVTTSGALWDLRGGVVDSTPARPRVELKRNQRPAMPQLVVGGGLTPRAGFRVGAGFARGAYRKATATVPDARATVFNLEAEYAFNRTRLSGEWVRDGFETTAGTVSARSFYVQGVQALTPRLFAAARVARTRTPPVFPGPPVRRTWTTAELTAGYRLTRDWTVRGGYYGQQTYTAIDWDHRAGVSLVWARRWF